MRKKQRHSGTRISLHPLSLEEAIDALLATAAPTRTHSPLEDSGSTTEPGPESGP